MPRKKVVRSTGAVADNCLPVIKCKTAGAVRGNIHLQEQRIHNRHAGRRLLPGKGNDGDYRWYLLFRNFICEIWISVFILELEASK